MSPANRRCAGAAAVRYVNVNPLDLLETIRERILVLEPDLTIRFANRSFCHTFAVAPEHTVGRKLYEIGNGQWDIPKLRTSLETIISDRKTIEAFEVEHFFPSIGRRIMLLNARTVLPAWQQDKTDPRRPAGCARLSRRPSEAPQLTSLGPIPARRRRLKEVWTDEHAG
jgi:PAS domain-containing protein